MRQKYFLSFSAYRLLFKKFPRFDPCKIKVLQYKFVDNHE